MRFEELAEYKKDLKSLLKRYRSLREDIAVVKKILEKLPKERAPFSYRIENLGIETCVIKVKKIACKSLKGKGVRSGLRLVYAYFEASPIIDENGQTVLNEQEEKIVLVELFHKNDKPNEDRVRIKRHFS